VVEPLGLLDILRLFRAQGSDVGVPGEAPALSMAESTSMSRLRVVMSRPNAVRSARTCSRRGISSFASSSEKTLFRMRSMGF
jgi:hypothetical protein